jgi:hypothetical protein
VRRRVEVVLLVIDIALDYRIKTFKMTMLALMRLFVTGASKHGILRLHLGVASQRILVR